MMIPTLQTEYDSEQINEEDERILRERVNNANAVATMLARYADSLSNPDEGDVTMLAMVADGIADMLSTAIEAFERAVLREYE